MRLTFRISVLACILVAIFASPSLAATNTDPTGDNCAGACGPDLTGVTDTVAADGSVTLTITRASSVCNTMSWPAAEVQPNVQFMTAASTDKAATASDPANVGRVWAVSSTSDFVWSSPTSTGSADDVPLTETVTPGSIVVTIPASIVASMGGLPLKFWLGNSCREFPADPILTQKDLAPDSGVYTLAPYDVCPNVDGAQAAVPTGSFTDASGNCVVDVCVNIAGGQAAAPAGFGIVPTTLCVKITFAGSAAANTLLGNALANVINALGGNDKLYGRAGNDTLRGGTGNDLVNGDQGNDKLFGDAGIDTAKGGIGADQVTGGLGKDKLYGDAGNDILYGNDRARGDVLYGGLGTDTCWYNTGDVMFSCERKVWKA